MIPVDPVGGQVGETAIKWPTRMRLIIFCVIVFTYYSVGARRSFLQSVSYLNECEPGCAGLFPRSRCFRTHSFVRYCGNQLCIPKLTLVIAINIVISAVTLAKKSRFTSM